MPITPEQVAAAKVIQDAAAHDESSTVRLVAGPGTGKSFAIEARVSWLLGEQAIPPSNIIAVSFTRAASKDLKDRIYNKCSADGHENFADLRVSTLHSLALWVLRSTGNLNQFPVQSPMILDDWEAKNIFDAEYGNTYKLSPTRCGEIRADHEAFWNTGIWNPASLPPPDEAISQEERNRFNTFYVSRTHTYACVLPGEVVRRCVELIQQGLIEVADVLGVQHVIVDEAQDLNPCDFEFVDALIAQGVNVFIAGDDDQSVYSFRHAYPQGIQDFPERYPNSGDHVLNECFRCTTRVLDCATTLLANCSVPTRIPKHLESLYDNANLPNQGLVLSKTLNTGVLEAAYVARSCQKLIQEGVNANDIMVLVGNKRATLRTITDAFDDLDDANVPYDANLKDDFIESDLGRFIQSALRIYVDADDYVAYRVLLGTKVGVGIKTCRDIADKVIANNLNFRNLFHNDLPNGVFVARETSAINAAKQNIAIIESWNEEDTIVGKAEDFAHLIEDNFGEGSLGEWQTFSQDLPHGMTLSELKEYLQNPTVDGRESILKKVYERLAIPFDEGGNGGPKVKIMSFHSSKGLSAKVVFIPCLEENIFPNAFAQGSAGRIFESARLLYVAITRAKAACIISRAKGRILQGKFRFLNPSRFCAWLGNPFVQENGNMLSDGEVTIIQDSIAVL